MSIGTSSCFLLQLLTLRIFLFYYFNFLCISFNEFNKGKGKDCFHHANSTEIRSNADSILLSEVCMI